MKLGYARLDTREQVLPLPLEARRPAGGDVCTDAWLGDPGISGRLDRLGGSTLHVSDVVEDRRRLPLLSWRDLLATPGPGNSLGCPLLCAWAASPLPTPALCQRPA